MNTIPLLPSRTTLYRKVGHLGLKIIKVGSSAFVSVLDEDSGTFSSESTEIAHNDHTTMLLYSDFLRAYTKLLARLEELESVSARHAKR